VLCNHSLFGQRIGETHQTHSLEPVFPEATYEIAASGRLREADVETARSVLMKLAADEFLSNEVLDAEDTARWMYSDVSDVGIVCAFGDWGLGSPAIVFPGNASIV